MRTDFYNSLGNLLISGDTIEEIYFYNAGAVVGHVRELNDHKIENGSISSIYDGNAERVIVDFDIKKAIKLNLDRKDAFYIKNPNKKYAIDKPYILYINSDLIGFDFIGDVLASKFDHEENYLEAYKITLGSAVFRRHKIERVLMDNYKNYTLAPGEQFSETCYGPDKEHACVRSFDNSENSYISKFHPEKISEKGIVRRWFEYETISNHEIIVTRPTFSKIIYDDYRTQQNALCEELKKAGFDYSYYQLDKLRSAGFDIVRIGGEKDA